MGESAKRLADVIISSLNLILLIIAGMWAYFRFRREGTHSPRVSFDIEAMFFSALNRDLLAEFLLVINNSGLVKHSFRRTVLRVRGISESSPITLWGDTQRVEFPKLLVDDADVLYSRKYGSIFVEPGVAQKLTFVARIPHDIQFVLVRAEFEYKFGRTHSAERVFEVSSIVLAPTLTAEAAKEAKPHPS